jgi:hypothetical protein
LQDYGEEKILLGVEGGGKKMKAGKTGLLDGGWELEMG